MKKEDLKPRRFIPLSRADIVQLCGHKLETAGHSEDRFQSLAAMITDLLHVEFHQTQEAFKRAYAAFDPNADTVIPKLWGAAEKPQTPELKTLLLNVLEKGNYEPLSEQDLSRALESSSMFKISLHIEFDDFDEVLLFCRGENVATESVKTWFGLRRQTVKFLNYDRVLLYIRFREEIDNPHPSCRPGSILLKLFEDVPRADLEMLFPNTRIRMRTLDKLLIGVPAAVGGAVVISTKLGGSLLLLASLAGYYMGTRDAPVALDKSALIALMAGLGALGAHFWKQFSAFKNRKLQFSQTLTQNLYFKNLDNNAGVFYRLLNDAEEEEGKEAVLALCFLMLAEQGLDAKRLDDDVEAFLQPLVGKPVDFEVSDALAKLERLDLLVSEPDGRYRLRPLNELQSNLVARWERLFGTTQSV